MKTLKNILENFDGTGKSYIEVVRKKIEMYQKEIKKNQKIKAENE